MSRVGALRFQEKVAFVFLGLIVAVFISLFVGHDTFAATKTWSGAAGDLQLSTAGNWSPSGAPVDGDSIVIDSSGGPISITYDVANLSLSGITVTGNNGVSIIGLGSTLALTGNVSAQTQGFVLLVDNIVLGANVAITNVSTFGSSNGGAAITLGGHELTVLTNQGFGTTTASISSKITGNGTITYNTPGVMYFTNNTNDYTGSTNLIAGTTSTIAGDSNSIYGTSVINIGTQAAIILQTGNAGTWTFNNTINIAAAVAESDGTFFSQLTVGSTVDNQQVTIPNIVLNGNARFMNFGHDRGVIVNLAGIQANGHCIQYGASQNSQASSFVNGPSACIVGDTNQTSGVKAPNTATKFIMANPILILILGAIAAGFFTVIAFRIKAVRK